MESVKSLLIVGMGWNEKYQLDQQAALLDDGTLVCFVKDAPAKKGIKIGFTKEWCMKMAELEGDSAIGAGVTPEQFKVPLSR